MWKLGNVETMELGNKQHKIIIGNEKMTKL